MASIVCASLATGMPTGVGAARNMPVTITIDIKGVGFVMRMPIDAGTSTLGETRGSLVAEGLRSSAGGPLEFHMAEQ
jgi:hypothetical protein